jgi:peptidoglycan/xylan/chitin deacetylase (PgdA/CDA1 family)
VRLGLAVLLAALSLPAAAAADRRPVPILMYHVIAPPNLNTTKPKLYVPPAEFAAEVRWLASRGYEAVTLRRVYDAWHGRASLPRRPVVLSFDDGYRSQYTTARPVLGARGWPGVLDLDLSNLGESWGLAPGNVRGLVAAGWEIDAHSLTHVDLRYLDARSLRREVAGSRAEIRRRFHVPADFFCYPAGLYNARVVAAVRAAGFAGATTVRFGLARRSEPFTLARVRIDGGAGIPGLRRKLAALGVD